MQISNSLIAFPSPVAEYSSEPTSLVELLNWRAKHQPDKQAYTFLADGTMQEVSMTYRDLDLRARAIGAQLQSLGMAGERVLLLFPSGLECIAAFFGCLYACAVAVPAYPPRANRSLDRIQAVSNDARPGLILTSSHIRSQFESLLAETTDLKTVPLLMVDAIEDDLAKQWQFPNVTEDTLAFLQYTSGSTATPKGVIVTHGNVLHNERMIERAFKQTEQSIIVGWLPLFHDMGLIGNVLQALYVGASCILLSPAAFLRRPLVWLETISRYRATVSGGPNFAYELCARRVHSDQRDSIDLSSWDTAFCGAEPVRKETLDRFAAFFEPCGFRRKAFHPCYGLAEATLFVSGPQSASAPTIRSVYREPLEKNRVVFASAEDPEAQSLVSCGKAWMGQRIKIVDPVSCTTCEAGRVGEIWVKGPSVAQGYWNLVEESIRTFRAYLTDTGEGPFLRTGDLGFVEDEEVYITGRLKDLIIIRGRNHYPQDIEFTVEHCHPAIRQGCAAAFSVEVTGEERLVVVQEIERRYQQGEPGEIVSAIRQAVAEEHEIQAYAVVLGKHGTVPRTSSGKLRRHACRTAFLAGTLSAIETSVSGSDDKQGACDQDNITRDELLAIGSAQERQSKLEDYVHRQVARALELAPSQVPLNQCLTTLGLDSITAMELQNRIETELNVFLPMASFLQDASISQLASMAATELARSIPERSPAVRRAANGADHPLSYGQQRLWFFDQLEPGNPAYNIPTAFRLVGHLNRFALEQAVSEITSRHETLRTTFKDMKGQPVQVISPLAQVTLPIVDLGGEPAIATAVKSVQLAAEEARRSFDLSRGPLVRVTLLRLSEEKHILLLTMHHIISDAWSLAVFLRELAALYTAYLAGDLSPLSSLPVQYVDYATWQRERLQGELLQTQLSYWKQKFSTLPAQLELPVDRTRPVRSTSRGACHWLTLPKDLSDGLRTLSHQEMSTLFMTLLTGVYVVLHRYTGQSDISVGSPIAGRNRVEFQKLIGFFLNTLAFRTDLSGNPTFRQLLGRVREVALQAYANQDLPFEQLVSAVVPERNVDDSPLYRVWFGLHKGSLPTVKLPAVTMVPIQMVSQNTKVDLAFHFAEEPEAITGKLEYNEDLFEATTIACLSEDFQTGLEKAVRQPDIRLSALEESLLQGSWFRQIREAESYEIALHRKLKGIRRCFISI